MLLTLRSCLEGATSSPRSAPLTVSLADFFIEVSRQIPLCLELEDLHWADGQSAKVLEFIIRDIGDARIALLATARVRWIGLLLMKLMTS